MDVIHECERVWIDGLEGFSPAECASSPHGCQARILSALGEDLTYDDLLCYSGFAFRVSWHEQACPSAGHPFCGYMCVENGERALPRYMERYECFPSGKPPKEREAFEARVCAAVKASIDRGVPVHYASEEDGLIIGYADEGRRWWCLHPYHAWGGEAFWYDEAEGFAGGKWPWCVCVWTDPKPPAERVSRRELTRAALSQAVDMWYTEKRGAYYLGEAAYAHWLQWLRDVERGTAEEPEAGMQGNGWCFDVLIHSRRVAGKWLGRDDRTTPADVRKHLEAASAHYTRLAEFCMKNLGNPWRLALPPGQFDAWTSAMRRDQIARLEAARDCDRAAIAEIDRALKRLR